MANCKKCGAPIVEGALFCTECGEALTEPFKPEVQSVGNPFEELDNNVPKPQAASELVFDEPDWKKQEEKEQSWHGATGYGKPAWGRPEDKQEEAAQPEQPAQSTSEQQASWATPQPQAEQQASWGAEPQAEQQASWTTAEPQAEQQASWGAEPQVEQQAPWGGAQPQPEQQTWSNADQQAYNQQAYSQQNYNNDPYRQGYVENKGLAVICYFSLLFWAIAYILASKKPKTEYMMQHLNQGVILAIGEIIAGFIQGAVGGVIALVVFVLAIMGIVYAIQGSSKPLPIIGQIRLFK